MSSGSLSRLAGSTSFRLSAVFAALLIAAFVIAALGARIVTKSVAKDELRNRVQMEMQALQDQIRKSGLSAAVSAIRARSESPGAMEYRLATSDGKVLAGKLKMANPALGWAFLDIPEMEAPSKGEGSDDFLVLTEQTTDGTILSIGDDFSRGERIRRAVLRTLFAIGAGSVLVAICAGALATWMAVRRVDGLSRTMVQVGLGDLSVRAVTRSGPRRDDVDRLGAGVNDMLDRIAGLVANIRRVSTAVAHDLRTPLTHVRQQLDLAAVAATPDASQDAIRLAQTKIDDVLRMFEATLRLAEIEAGAARARFTSVNLAELVERVTDAYRPDIEAAGHPFVVGPLDAATVTGDADLIAQALSNLLENALRHTPPQTLIMVWLYRDDVVTKLDVVDCGPGVPSPDRERITEPFVRLDASRSSPGAGLGLSIVDAIARLHDARLVLDDAEPGLRASLEWRRT